MEVPSPAAGKVTDITVAVGDKVAEGSVILTLEGAESARTAPSRPPTRPPRKWPEPKAPEAPAADVPDADVNVQVAVLGGGPGGYTAAFRAADLGLSVALIDRGEQLGGVCLNVGCIPSKALLHVAKVMTEAAELGEAGITFEAPKIDVDKVREFKNGVVGRLTGGLESLAKQRKVQVVRGTGEFTSPNTIAVGDTVVGFENCIIAVGLGGGDAAVPARGRPDRRLHRRAGGRRHPGAAAGHRRRHHRPRDGDGLRRARLQGHRRRAARPADPGRRQGPDPRARQARQGPLRGDPPQDRRRVRRGGRGRPDGQVRRAHRGRSTGSSSPSAASPTASDRRRQGGRERHRPRLRRVRPADEDQRRRTSTRSATSAASRCWPTRPRTRARWRPRSSRARTSPGTCARSRRVAYTDPEVAWTGPHRDAGQGRGDPVRGRRVPVGGVAAARSAWAAPTA